MTVKIKICGLTNPRDVEPCIRSSVDYVGFVFHKGSKRNLELLEAARIATLVPKEVLKVALIVDPLDSELDNLFSNFPVDVLQLHGEEQPERVSIIRTKFKVPVIKSVSLRTKQDLIKIRDFSLVADQLLIDAEKPDKLSPPGGNGVTFDWKLISGFDWKVPWMLAGGLDCSNVQEAIATSGAKQVDVSSGVESRPGIKDTKLIYDFVSTVRGKNYDG